MEELEKMINTKPLNVNPSIDPRVQRLLKKILKKNSWERLSCDGILKDPDFANILSQCNLDYLIEDKLKKNMNYLR
jgi:serine/threonine protein kinase